jgi:hypothetical protein
MIVSARENVPHNGNENYCLLTGHDKRRLRCFHVLSFLTGDNSAWSSLPLASVVIKVNHTRDKNINLRSDLLDNIQETARCGLP